MRSRFVVLTFLKRKNYKATAQSSGNLDRILANPTKDIEFLTSRLGEKYEIEVVSFEDMPFKDVLEQMAKTDVFVGIHGAGNVHMMFLPDHAAFIDFVPETIFNQTRYHDLAQCLNISYVKEKANIVKAINKGKRITLSLTGDGNNFLKTTGPNVLLDDLTTAIRRKGVLTD